MPPVQYGVLEEAAIAVEFILEFWYSMVATTLLVLEEDKVGEI